MTRATSRKQVRATALGNVRRVVVQVGRSLLEPTPVARIRALAMEMAALRQSGVEVAVVTSGAILLGARRLELDRTPRQLSMLNAISAVGQVELVRIFEDALSAHGLLSAQAMVTAADLDDPGRFLRLRHTVMTLLDYGAVPLLGENQVVCDQDFISSTSDQNDVFAARITRLLEADLLVLLTSADGLYDSSPRRGGEVVHVVEDIEELAARARANLRRRNAHPAAAKVLAAHRAASFGVPTVVASGVRAGVLRELLDDDQVGTLILPPEAGRSRKQWIARDRAPAGTVTMNAEARQEVLEQGRSLQASGVAQVSGHFAMGDAVRVLDEAGRELARGLVGYSSGELSRIQGKEPEEIEQLLDCPGSTEVIRRDDLIIL